eukprot:s368_g13.t1
MSELSSDPRQGIYVCFAFAFDENANSFTVGIKLVTHVRCRILDLRCLKMGACPETVEMFDGPEVAASASAADADARERAPGGIDRSAPSPGAAGSGGGGMDRPISPGTSAS